MMAWYNLKKVQKEPNSDKRFYLAKTKYEKIICDRTRHFKGIIGDNIEPNVQYRIVTDLAFNAIVIIEYLMTIYEITDITIAVYRMNERSVYRLKEIIDNKNIKCNILLSNFFRQNKKYEKWCEELILYAKNKEGVDIGFVNNHAKVFLAKTTTEKYIVFEGSGNLSDNARIEQYLLEDNQYVYEFHEKWILENLKNKKWK